MSLNKFKTRSKVKIQMLNLFLTLTIETVALNCAEAIKIKCTNTDDFHFPSPGSDCSMYYKCSTKGEKEIHECGSGLRFDFYTQSCSHSLVKCSEPFCIGRSNGIYQDTTHACMRYFTCFAGQVTSVDNCPSKHLHNGQKCVQQDQVACDATSNSNSINYLATSSTEDHLCQYKVDGFISDPTSKDCSMYIACKDGKYNGRRHCNNQAVFNGESCVPSPLHECSLSKRHTDIRAMDQCYRRSNGYYAYPQHGCTSYARCMSEQMVEVGLCPADQYFDMEIGKCIYERTLERRRCFERGHSKDCDGREDGYYSELKCDSYFYCHAGYKIEYKCSPGKVFNGQACVPKSQHKCSKIDINNVFCTFRPDGYYKDPNDGCRAYSYCSNGHKITYICEPGHTFDSQSKKCVRKELLPSNHCPADYICYGKSDGYHIDLQSNCRSYVYCINNEKITQITCRDEKIFNGQKCVPPTEYDCPSLFSRREINCVPRNCLRRCESNGFYADLSSGCRDFHICINGKSSKASCQAGMRFNGDICTAEDRFTCPTICTRKYDIDRECPLEWYVA